MTLSPDLLALASQWSQDQRAEIASRPNSGTRVSARKAPATEAPAIRANAARNAVRDARDAYEWQRFLGRSRGDAARNAVYGIVPNGQALTHAAMIASGCQLVDTGSELYWASDGSHNRRKPPKRKPVDTNSASMGRDNRSFDGTMARVADGGVSKDYKPGTSAGYGHKITERKRKTARTAREFTVTFCVVFTSKPVALASYVDNWSADRASAEVSARREFAHRIAYYANRHPWRIDIAESGSEPIAMPTGKGKRKGKRKQNSGTIVSSAPRPARETPNPFDGSYAEWRTAIVGALASIARELSPSKRAGEFVPVYRPYDRAKLAKMLRDYQLWAQRYGWTEAEEIVSDAISALRDESLASDGLAHSFNQADQRIPRGQ